jgi:NADH-quinone oxidoreductase subunit G
MTDMVTLKINDREVTVPKGTTVLEAARTIGIEIPHFCYHPALELVGSCRMCQVEFSGGGRTYLGVSCRTDVADGMEVQTHSEDAKRARAGVLEFLLANHPLDCAICDKAGECPLQNYTYEHGFTESRFKEMRRKGLKKTPFGGHIVFDSERCILCTRCTRFMAEYARAPQLTVAGRGDHSVITTFPGEKLDSEYTGNLADICPVGALTLDEFRFRCRVWNLDSTPSICPYCSRGCNLLIDKRKGHKDVLRVLPRPNAAVHGEFICNEGRFRPLQAAGGDRLEEALIKGGSAPLDSALEAAAEGLQEQGGRLLVVTSVQRPTEEIYLTKVILEPLAGDKIVALRPQSEEPDEVLRTGELGANVKACEALDIALVTTEELDGLLTGGEIDALLLCDPSIALSAELRGMLGCLVYLGHIKNETAAMADAALPGLTWLEKEGTFINFQGRIQRFQRALPPPGEAVADLVILSRLGRLLGAEHPSDPSGLFKAMAADVPAFKGLTYGDIGDKGALLRGTAEKDAATEDAASEGAKAEGGEQ